MILHCTVYIMISDISVQSIFSGNSIDSDNAQKF